jgi:hypothetical protein
MAKAYQEEQSEDWRRNKAPSRTPKIMQKIDKPARRFRINLERYLRTIHVMLKERSSNATGMNSS